MANLLSPPQKFHSIPDWATPRTGLFHVFTDRWWVVDDDGNPLFYGRELAPQCNTNRDIAVRIANGRPIRQLAVVYVPIKTSDWRHG